MKKVILSMMAIVIAASAQAQFYAKVGVGLNMAAANTIVARKVTDASSEVVKGSYGKGISPVLGVGYMFNPHVGVELAASYLLGSEYESTSTTAQAGSSTVHMKAMGINVLPAIVLKTGENESKFRLYSRAGLNLAIGTKFMQHTKTTVGVNTAEKTTEYKGNASLGYTGAIGVSYRINKMASLWVEVVANSTSTWLKSAEVTESTLNGVDNLSTLTGLSKSWTYEDKQTSSSTSKEAYSEPMSSIGLAIGATFSFGGKK